MGHSFLQKLMLIIFAGFVAACLLYAYKHIVHQAIWESSNEGWKESMRSSQTQRR